MRQRKLAVAVASAQGGAVLGAGRAGAGAAAFMPKAQQQVARERYLRD